MYTDNLSNSLYSCIYTLRMYIEAWPITKWSCQPSPALITPREVTLNTHVPGQQSVGSKKTHFVVPVWMACYVMKQTMHTLGNDPYPLVGSLVIWIPWLHKVTLKTLCLQDKMYTLHHIAGNLSRLAVLSLYEPSCWSMHIHMTQAACQHVLYCIMVRHQHVSHDHWHVAEVWSCIRVSKSVSANTLGCQKQHTYEAPIKVKLEPFVSHPCMLIGHSFIGRVEQTCAHGFLCRR